MAKHTAKHSDTVAFQRSDRLALIAQANELVTNTFFTKHKQHEGYNSQEVVLSREEENAYNSALALLAREFDKGPSSPVFYLSKCDCEQSTEINDVAQSSTTMGNNDAEVKHG